jgi:hypothetical protein
MHKITWKRAASDRGRVLRQPLGLLLAVTTSFVGALAGESVAQEKSGRQAIEGRWDLTLHGPDATSYPSWLEVRRSGNSSLVGTFVGRFGSARPIGKVEFDGTRLRFQIPPQWEKRDSDLEFEGTLAEDHTLAGVTVDEAGQRVTWIGRSAPNLKRSGEIKWGETIELFNQKDLSGWQPLMADVPNGWEVRDGLLVNARPGNNLRTERTFEDFRLVAEFRYPQGSNSGIYLRGRYELQIEDNYGQEAECHKIGGVYGFLTPSINAAKPAGEWQTYEVELVGRTITIYLNGERVVDRQDIPGITGGAIDSDEGTPGPLYLQGDHGPIEFRRVSITVPAP